MMSDEQKKPEPIVVSKNSMLTLGALLALMPAIGTYYVTQHKVEAQAISIQRLETEIDIFKKDVKLEMSSTKKEWLLEIKELNRSFTTIESDVGIIKYRLNVNK